MMIPRLRFVVTLSALIVALSWAMSTVAQQTSQSRQRRPGTATTTQNQQQRSATQQSRRNASQQKAAPTQTQRRTTQPAQTQRQPSTANRSQAPRQLTPQQQRQRQMMSQRQRPQPNRTARRAAPPAKPRSSSEALQTVKPTVIEKSDPAQRAEFLKLVGANWIWSPAHPKDEAPVGDCYFRKTFTLKNPEFGQVHVTCDNAYELYANGRLAGQGNDWRKMNVHDIETFLVPGTNVVAIKATNSDAGAAGLAARVVIKERGSTFESYSTDATWRTSVKLYIDWMHPRFRESEWVQAKVYGPLGAVLPWGDEVVIADEGSRFLIDPEFAIERVVTNEQAGSLIAMAFNASGDILTSQEGGPLMLARKNDKGVYDRVAPYCREVRNVQGILPMGNRVFVVGEGPDGGALYQMTDKNSDGVSDELTALVKFDGAIGEHGPHTVRLGPDGLLYLLCGNFAQPATEVHPKSPHQTLYEGDLIQPRYEDPQGYALNVKAPGGAIYRTDTSGSFVERVAGGFRNPYDFAFNADGELFTNDADMEWDVGAPWYRPTRVSHVPLGGEFGWRSGWAKWPEYFLDSLPATLDIGPGSPTGVVYYDHNAFPDRLRSTLFVADWALGQIHAVKLQRRGETYTAKMSTFLKGRPLNVTGMDVGPDGALYFCTGGRGTDGGIYRARWIGAPAAQDIQFGQGIAQALHQPQLQSDWARMRIAAIKRSAGDAWQTDLERVLDNKQSLQRDRLRAIELLNYFGPQPSPQLLIQLSQDADPAMRARAARLMGTRVDAEFAAPLTMLLSDRDAWVRRVACESIAHRGDVVRGSPDPAPAGRPSVGDVAGSGDPATTNDAATTKTLVGLLADSDRFVAFAARRALEKRPAAEWQEPVLTIEDPRPFLQGAAGLMVSQPSPEVAVKVLARCEAILKGNVQEPGKKPGYLSDANFMDLLRVVQLALLRGEIKAADVPTLGEQLLREYPTKHALLNRELVRLLAYLQPPGAASALARQISGNIAEVETLQIAAYAPRISQGWETSDKMVMLSYFEKVRGIEGGHSVAGYIENFARDFFTHLTPTERRQLIAAGEHYPMSTLSALAKLENPEPELLAEIRALDQRLEGKPGEPIARLRVGIVAVLGGSGETESLQYLRDLYMQDPQRRAPVAMSLTQNPSGENWPILVDSLRTVEGEPARTILTALGGVERRPETSEPFRNTILLGLRMREAGGELATQLLEKWLGQTPYAADAPLAERLSAWQNWYANTFPSELPAQLAKESQPNRWSFEELLSYLESPEGKAGSPTRGKQAFHTAQCVSCHRFNGHGEGIGPDLTAVAQRFQRKEILESIVHPNQVVSDQYASHIVVAGGKTYTGFAATNPDGSMTILQADMQKITLAKEDIKDVQRSKTSSMPEGLLNKLPLEQVADLFAFLMNAPEPNMASRPTMGTR